MLCPSCDIPKSNPFLGAASTEFRLYKCGGCGLVSTHPMPDDERLLRFYQGFKFEPPAPATLVAEIEAVRVSLEGLCKGVERRRFLDFGGGCGIYAAAARQLGFEVTLFDVDESGLAFAGTELGIVNRVNRFEDLSGEFEVVLSYHVIEHSNDLARDFKRLSELLAPEGRLIIATPNCESFEKYFMLPLFMNYVRRLRHAGVSRITSLMQVLKPDSILCWDPPRHIYALSQRSLQALAKKHGLRGETFCPYNTDIRFEPRQYVLPKVKSLADWRANTGPAGSSWTGMSHWLARHLSVVATRGGICTMAKIFPNRGGQLYGVFDKPAAQERTTA
jgi:2-polyprenyl-3-methyl-5-hydroxy-6-metoxy-1,4-benzoquinol methylase